MQVQFRLNYQALWGQSIYLQVYTGDEQYVRHGMICKGVNL